MKTYKQLIKEIYELTDEDRDFSDKVDRAIKGKKEDLDKLISHDHPRVRTEIAKHGHKEHLDKLVHDPSPVVRRNVALHGNKEHLDILKKDKDPMVKKEVDWQSIPHDKKEKIRKEYNDSYYRNRS